jgi:DnaJ-domain-containing protein 1
VIRWLLLLAVVVLVWRRLRRLLAPGRIPGARDPAWDPYAELGVSPGASREAITRAYHEQVKRYHPDRVADLGVELQELAHSKTITLRRAYDELTR